MKRFLLALLMLAGNGILCSAKTVTIDDIKHTQVSNQVIIDPLKLMNALKDMDFHTMRTVIRQMYEKNPEAFGAHRIANMAKVIDDSEYATKYLFYNYVGKEKAFIRKALEREESLWKYIRLHLQISIYDLIKNDQSVPEFKEVSVEILKIFDEIGLKETYCKEQRDLIDQYCTMPIVETVRIDGFYLYLAYKAEEDTENIEKRIAFLMQLAQTSNIELPEELKSDWRN